jgi:repressor LexA
MNQKTEGLGKMEVGNRIQELRKLNNMTGKELAEQIGVSPSFISAIEHNSTKLSLDTLNHICKVLDVTLAEFFSSEMSPVEQKLISKIKKMANDKQHELLAFLTGLIS